MVGLHGKMIGYWSYSWYLVQVLPFQIFVDLQTSQMEEGRPSHKHDFCLLVLVTQQVPIAVRKERPRCTKEALGGDQQGRSSHGELLGSAGELICRPRPFAKTSFTRDSGLIRGANSGRQFGPRVGSMIWEPSAWTVAPFGLKQGFWVQGRFQFVSNTRWTFSPPRGEGGSGE